jgi:U3 small nucleolar RNA-associated protein 13
MAPAMNDGGSGPVQPKQTYKAKQKLEVFYTGGAARITRDGKLLACACNEEVKVS